ncbi:hypothetical protein [Roseobacter sp. OBYS 0001]|uniref:hypothetical protein n=1 Tax=Roseobacter sp. OBYS 0001 TaxID=882651 RepID=UPI001BB86981|nr:hypothetical protein [Roseobacter sp. OBYS 0001]GIT87742.1 hypothetical protein ROBYS_27580 [Roseobacter sp. OBYS 0001]
MKNKFIAAAALAFLTSNPVAAEPTNYGKQTAFGTVSGVEMSKKAKTAYRQFRGEANYFGAMYTNMTTDLSYWVWGLHNLSDARQAARADCELGSGGKGNCTLAALSYPRGTSPNDDFSNGLSQEGSKDFETEYKGQQKAGKYGAFAISRVGSWGYSWSFDERSEALATALLQCEASTKGVLADLNAKQRDWARRNGYVECKVVDIFEGR